MDNSRHLKAAAEAIGRFIEYWGFRSIDGRVWALIYLSEKPISTPQIVDILGVSKGLVSIATNELVEYKLIKQGDKAVYGAQTYYAEDDIIRVIRGVLKKRELLLITEAQTHLEALAKLSKEHLAKINVSSKRLQDLIDFNVACRDLLARLVSDNAVFIASWISIARDFLKLLKVTKRSGG